MKISIVGITGYSGLELVKILNNHKKVELVSIHATKEVGRRLSDVYPYLTGVCDLEIEAYDAEKIMQKADLVFFATPSGVASSLAEEFVLADFPIIDLSGDHRLPADVYQEWYKKSPAKQSVLNKFTYALSEYADVKDQKFIANPGCYATATELALIPLVVTVSAIANERPQSLCKLAKMSLGNQHHVNIFGGSEVQVVVGHDDVTSGAADDYVRIFVAGKGRSDELQALCHIVAPEKVLRMDSCMASSKRSSAISPRVRAVEMGSAR